MAPAAAAPALLPRSWYRASVAEFCADSRHSILGTLTANSHLEVTAEQRDAWLQEIEVLQQALIGILGTLLLEFTIPRMGHRADAVLLLDRALVVFEFKATDSPARADLDQVWDYALDLKHFHGASHDLAIVPVLAHPGHPGAPRLEPAEDGIYHPTAVNFANLGPWLRECATLVQGRAVPPDWERAPYHPTPTIIEAARALYAGHQVEEIARSEAGENLARTSQRLLEIVNQAAQSRHKAICFVTGVPGAGKTLVGLNLATRRDAAHHAVFLSGNGPLVAVLRAALARDERARTKKRPRLQAIKSFIQNIHHFRDEGLTDDRPPDEHVVIFDEAQRAWNQARLSDFMKRRKHRPDFHQSEPQTLLEYMDRRPDWAAVIALVGSGQEIHTGEAGIAIWLQQLNQRLADWQVFLPHQLGGDEFGAQTEIDALATRGGVTWEPDLHLAVSVRSFRAENVSAFVQALLDLDHATARAQFDRLRDRYPIVLTRNLDAAKRWVRRQARASERYGLLASSRALRLKPYAVDVRVSTDPVHWFLNDREDIRSSFYLEDPATEFDVQGLELDWACVTWDGDLRHRDGHWAHHDFRGTKWNRVHDPDKQVYIRNAYRVLLTRARQGMAIFVPPGSVEDPTRPPAYYDATFGYLADLGLPLLH